VLVRRIRGDIGLTASGETLLPVARRMLADAETARREIRELAELGRGRVRLGATPSLCTRLLPRTLGCLPSGAPRRGHTGCTKMVRAICSATWRRVALDFALVIDARLDDDPVLATIPLLAEDLVVISSPDEPPLTRRARMNIVELKGVPLVMFRPGYDLRETTIAACHAAGFEPTFAVEGGEMDAVLEFVDAGLGVAVVPSTMVDGPLRATPFRAPGLSRRVLLARRRDLEPPRAAQTFIEMLVDYLRYSAANNSLPLGTTDLTGGGVTYRCSKSKRYARF